MAEFKSTTISKRNLVVKQIYSCTQDKTPKSIFRIFQKHEFKCKADFLK